MQTLRIQTMDINRKMKFLIFFDVIGMPVRIHDKRRATLLFRYDPVYLFIFIAGVNNHGFSRLAARYQVTVGLYVSHNYLFY